MEEGGAKDKKKREKEKKRKKKNRILELFFWKQNVLGCGQI